MMLTSLALTASQPRGSHRQSGNSVGVADLHQPELQLYHCRLGFIKAALQTLERLNQGSMGQLPHFDQCRRSDPLGVAQNAEDLGTFTGSTISGNVTVKRPSIELLGSGR